MVKKDYWRTCGASHNGMNPNCGNMFIDINNMNNYYDFSTMPNIQNISVKPNTQISELKQKCIKYNNEVNAKNKDARDLLNIALVGTKNLTNTPEYNILTIQECYELSRKLKFNLMDNDSIVRFSENSSLAKAVNNSEMLKKTLKKWVQTNPENRPNYVSVQLKDNDNLFRSINNATILQPRIDENYITGFLFDRYDFKLQWFNNQKILEANTGAFILQGIQQLENYKIIVPIKVKL